MIERAVSNGLTPGMFFLIAGMQSQIRATTISFMRYAGINYLSEKEHHRGLGPLFEGLADKTATFTYA